MTKKELLWTFVFLLLGLSYLFGLFIDLTGDSGLYAVITRQMVESGDWFNLQINNNPYDQKPHLFFWLAGVGIQLFGNTNFAFKLFPFLYGLLGIYFAYRLGKTIYSKESGKLAALILTTSQISFLYFFDLHMDSILQTGVMLALWQLAEYLKHDKPQNFIFGFFGVGLAMFSKGPIGAVIPFFAVLFYLISERSFKEIFRAKWLLGGLIVLVVISPTLVHLYKNFGAEGLRFYFITNNVGRITGKLAGSNSDPFFYLHTLLWAFLPWTFFVVFALFTEVKTWFNKTQKKLWSYFLLGSVFVMLLILSIAKGKAPNYFLIAVAPISVFVGNWLNVLANYSPQDQKRILFWQNIFVGLLGVFLVFLVVVYRLNGIYLPLFILLLSISLIVYSRKIETTGIKRMVLLSVIIVSSLNLYLNIQLLPAFYNYQAARQVLSIYEIEKELTDKLYNFHTEDYELFFYAQDSVIQINNSPDYNEMIKNKGTWLYTTKSGYDEFVRYGFKMDTVYYIPNKGMNKLNLKFLNPKTRESSLDTSYLIRID